MKRSKMLSMILAILLLLVMVIPAQAQLGDTNTSQFTIQNISGTSVSVTVKFIAEDGSTYTPQYLNNALTLPNPFTLNDGVSQQIYVPDVPGLADGSYAVEISSTGKIVAMAGLAGDTSTRHFVGSYSGFTSGSNTAYLPVANYNYYGWFSMISVQNLGDQPANIDVTITCSNTPSIGKLTQPSVPPKASHTFVLKNEVPTDFTTATQCNGSATVTSNQPIAVVNNQNQPNAGNTISYGAESLGNQKVFIANLQTDNSGWNASLNIRKLGSGNTTVTIDYSDGEPNDTCNLSDATPACNLYMPTVHPTKGRFSAVLTTSGMPIIAQVGTSKGNKSGAVVGVATGSPTVSVPLSMKNFYGWSSAVNCQNISPTQTKLSFSFTNAGVNYNDPTTLNEGESIQILTVNVPGLPATYSGGVIVSAVTAGAEIACTVGNTNNSTVAGDWTNQYNAFEK